MRVPDRTNARWSLNFVSETFTDGRRFRILAVVDDYTRECLALVSCGSRTGCHQPLARSAGHHVSDNGTYLTSMAILHWCQAIGVEWHCIAPGKPTQNACRRELQRALQGRMPQ